MVALKIKCPECAANFTLEGDSFDPADIFTCPHCDSSIKIVSLDPLEVKCIKSGNESR